MIQKYYVLIFPIALWVAKDFPSKNGKPRIKNPDEPALQMFSPDQTTGLVLRNTRLKQDLGSLVNEADQWLFYIHNVLGIPDKKVEG